MQSFWMMQKLDVTLTLMRCMLLLGLHVDDQKMSANQNIITIIAILALLSFLYELFNLRVV